MEDFKIPDIRLMQIPKGNTIQNSGLKFEPPFVNTDEFKEVVYKIAKNTKSTDDKTKRILFWTIVVVILAVISTALLILEFLTRQKTPVVL